MVVAGEKNEPNGGEERTTHLIPLIPRRSGLRAAGAFRAFGVRARVALCVAIVASWCAPRIAFGDESAPDGGHRGPPPEPGAPIVAMSCEPIALPGRVRCEVEARPSPGGTLRWGDVEIAGVPRFAVPLKGRIGPRDAISRDEAGWRWAFALVARERGVGEVQARVRLVVCSGTRCEPRVTDVVARVQVGAP